jgi:hypothetical protein
MARGPEVSDSTERLTSLDGEVAEMLLLLPTDQAARLEEAARRRGLTSAELTRRLIRGFLQGLAEEGRGPAAWGGY